MALAQGASSFHWRHELRAIARRRSLSVIAAALVIAGCAAPAPESKAPSATTPSASATPTTPASAPAATSSPTPTEAPSTAFGYSDILRVEVNGLAVRQAPLLSSGLAQGFRSQEPIGDVRLDAGDFVSVELGPLPIGDTVWYLVWPAEDAQLMYSTVSWDADGNGPAGGGDPGWMAASVGDEPYLTLYRPAEASESGSPSAGSTILLAAGTGNYESPPQGRHDNFAFRWAVAVDNHPAPCAFSVTLVPAGGAASPVLAVETSTTDVEQGPFGGAGSGVYPPWDPAAGGSWDSFTVSIKSGCTWAVMLWPLPHD
jgi:hypothetical protein